MAEAITMRLCDDQGIVSHERAEGAGHAANPAKETYLERHNRLVRMLSLPELRREPVMEPFACTGSAHIGPEVFHCSSPAHETGPWGEAAAASMERDRGYLETAIQIVEVERSLWGVPAKDDAALDAVIEGAKAMLAEPVTIGHEEGDRG